jgi:hypothetical protein
MFELKRCREAVEVRCRGGEEIEQRRGKLCYVLGRRARVRLQWRKVAPMPSAMVRLEADRL